MVSLKFTNNDKTPFGAILRKIERPTLLQKIFRNQNKVKAVEFMESMICEAAERSRYDSCKFHQDCTDFVLNIAKTGNRQSVYKSLASQANSCLGFSCLECQFFQTTVEVDLPAKVERYFFKMPNPWEITVRCANRGLPLIGAG
jgi:hypothetical protein